MYPSPDGNSFAYHRIHGPDGDNKVIQDIWIYNRQRDFSTPLTTDDAADIAPVWSPDGKTIVYSSSPDSVYNIYEKNIEIDAKPKLLFKNNIVVKSPFDWSKDGKYILLGVFDPETKADIWLMPMFGDKKPFPYLQTKFNEYAGSFSPDSKWLAYSSDETGRPEVYIQNFPEPGKKYVVSTEGGRYPKWSKDGNELFYISTNGYMTAVDIKLKDKPEIGKAKKLFKVNHLLPYPNMYEVLNNGQSFLFNNWEFNSKIKSLRVIVNWRDLLNDK
jgi:Tol biopolymer transport system component